MKNLRTKLAILVISSVSFLGIQSASAVEGLTIGISYGTQAYMGKGKEESTSSGAAAKKVTEEDGAFKEDGVPAVFVEYNLSDMIALGFEYVAEDVKTPQNTNVQDSLTNTVKAQFNDHMTIYANIMMPFNTYIKLGYSQADVATQESLGTGGAYPDVDTDGYTIGLGYQHNAGNGMFVRIEASAAEYADVSANNTNEADKKISVTDMYGAQASLKVGKTF